MKGSFFLCAPFFYTKLINMIEIKGLFFSPMIKWLICSGFSFEAGVNIRWRKRREKFFHFSSVSTWCHRDSWQKPFASGSSRWESATRDPDEHIWRLLRQSHLKFEIWKIKQNKLFLYRKRCRFGSNLRFWTLAFSSRHLKVVFMELSWLSGSFIFGSKRNFDKKTCFLFFSSHYFLLTSRDDVYLPVPVKC